MCSRCVCDAWQKARVRGLLASSQSTMPLRHFLADYARSFFSFQAVEYLDTITVVDACASAFGGAGLKGYSGVLRILFRCQSLSSSSWSSWFSLFTILMDFLRLCSQFQWAFPEQNSSGVQRMPRVDSFRVHQGVSLQRAAVGGSRHDGFLTRRRVTISVMCRRSRFSLHFCITSLKVDTRARPNFSVCCCCW